jgi:carboxylate-amine ligase
MGSAIDLHAAREIFGAATDLTVGLEEEFAILDPETLDLAPRYEELRDGAAPELQAQLTGELISSEIEIISGRGEDLVDALRRQSDARRLLFAHCAEQGAALGATGTHPWADYREQPNIDTPHYRRVVEGLQYVARRNNTFSLHVHVGVRDADRAVRVCDRLRPVLPLLLALSASSPYLDGRDSGLHSARTQSFTRQFPRCGIPDAYGSWDAYAQYIDLLVRTRSIVEYTQVWWSVRPHFSFGTVEVRICDVQQTARESDLLSGLVVACVAQAARDLDEGAPFEHPAPRLVEENLWRAIRFGMDAPLIDLARGEEVAPQAVLEALWDWTEPVRGALGVDEAPDGPTGAQRQRAMAADGATPHEVYACTVRETADTYGSEVRSR